MNRLVGLAEAAGAVLIVGGTGFATFKAFRSMAEDFKLTVDAIKDTDWETGKKALVAMGGFIGAFVTIGAIIGKSKGGIGLGIEALAGEAVLGGLITLSTFIVKVNAAFARDAVIAFKETINNVKEAIDSLDQLDSVTNVGEVKTRIKNAITLFSQIRDIISPNRNNPVFGQTDEGLRTLSGDAVTSLQNYADAISHIKSIVNKLNQLGTIQIADVDVEGMMSDLHSKLDSVYTNLKSLPNIGDTENQMTGLANAMIQVRRVIYHLNKIGSLKVSTNGGANIKKAINSIKEAFTDSSVGALASQIQAFATSIKNALAEIRALDGEVEVNVTFKLSDGFYSTKASVIKAIKKAKNDIKAQKKAISFTIPVSVRFSVSTNLGNALARIRSAGSTLASAGRGQRPITVHQATGGMIYRAKGGDVPKRRGTDTIHAMLTPGEYVQNKKAVSLFGIDFMRKVNNLDMKGAMTELMHRAGNMANVGRQTVINNYYNNNQKVTQNINNPSPGFAFKSASRFVGAF